MFANALGIFAPVITIVLFAVIAEVQGSPLDEVTAFTTVATLAIVTHPANMIMTIIPNAVAAFASFDRIQEYLLEEPLADQRQVSESEAPGTQTSDYQPGIVLTDMTVSKPASMDAILRDVTLSMEKGTVTIMSGEITVCSKRIGYCDQTVWLPPGTIKEIVCSFETNVDEQRYKRAITSCCLDQDLASLPARDETQVGSQGMNLSGGQRQRLALARLLYSRCDIAILDDPFTALDGTTETSVVENVLGERGWLRQEKTTVFLISNSAQHFHLADQVALLDGGKLQCVGSCQDLKTHFTEIRKFTFGADREKSGAERRRQTPQEQAKILKNHDAELDLHRKTGDLSLYRYYGKAAGAVSVLLVVGCTASYSVLITVPHYWIKWWTGSGPGQLAYYAGGYVLLAVIAWASTSGTMCAPLSFFSTKETGVIINRFGQDIDLVDKHLPFAFMTLCNQVFKLTAQILVLVKVQGLLLVSFPVCAVAVVIIQRFYMQTSRQLRVMELESQSALFTSFLETVRLKIQRRRYSNMASDMNYRNSQSLDKSLRPLYLLLCLQRWLNLVLDLTMSAIAVGVIGLAVRRSSSMSGADVGVALNVILVANSTLVALVRSWTSLEMSLGAIARIRQIDLHTPREDLAGEDTVPDAAWPSKGEISFEDVTAYYGSNHVVVRGVDLRIRSGQKVVLCGRTGSGKSTLLTALLRLTDYTGSITVDGRDISRIPKSVVRQRCFITVPQDPFMIPEATLAFNLDPSSLASEQVLHDALAKVGLWRHLSGEGDGSESNPLDRKLSSLPSLSAGGSQLLAMARAMVQKHCARAGAFFVDREDVHTAKPILLLDEATSSLDPTTEATIYNLIESEFVDAGHTVIMVSHRLSSLSGRMRDGKDIVALLEQGRLTKVGSYEDMAEYVNAAEELS
ncbi:ABC multidrug transporter [Purpureocillium lavendulum]|uniref:ABC multidrug transporter n=1 Tax=Purpureocillium lavendulum TaxID=1247861 RepID=A0AB34FIQ4_9HYPO|nr:ABC multidrug transporter [Purpureocillium lavendulum]